MNKRKGARKLEDIPKEILVELNKGTIESVNLTEWLAVDQRTLVKNVLSKENQDKCIEALEKLTPYSTLKAIRCIAEVLYTENLDIKEIDNLRKHTSDTVRCWAACLVGLNKKLSIKEKLSQIKPFAEDEHFGVREIAWLSAREDISSHLNESIAILKDWSQSDNQNIRRFSIESIRPNGVWCKKIEILKEKPHLAIEILENLKSDESKYVQDSVANYLNDASKTQPEFVKTICEKWLKESPTKETSYIVKRALRSINKNGDVN